MSSFHLYQTVNRKKGKEIQCRWCQCQWHQHYRTQVANSDAQCLRTGKHNNSQSSIKHQPRKKCFHEKWRRLWEMNYDDSVRQISRCKIGRYISIKFRVFYMHRFFIRHRRRHLDFSCTACALVLHTDTHQHRAHHWIWNMAHSFATILLFFFALIFARLMDSLFIFASAVSFACGRVRLNGPIYASQCVITFWQ